MAASPLSTLTLDHQRLHLALYTHCYLHSISDTEAAKATGLLPETLERIKHGQNVKWDTLLRVCLWLDEGPREFIQIQPTEP